VTTRSRAPRFSGCHDEIVVLLESMLGALEPCGVPTLRTSDRGNSRVRRFPVAAVDRGSSSRPSSGSGRADATVHARSDRALRPLLQTVASAIGWQRRYMLYEPGFPQARACAMLVLLHGCRQDARTLRSAPHEQAAEEAGVVVLYPEQSILANALRCWNWIA